MEPPDPEPLGILLALFNPISLDVGLAILLSFVLVGCSALISGSEVAFFSLGPNEKNDLGHSKSAAAKRILGLLERPQRLLATILIANNFVNIAIVIISSFIVVQSFNFEDYASWVAVAIQVGGITFLLLLFGEVIPKVYATSNGLLLCKVMSAPLGFLGKLFYPLSSILISSTNIINKRVKKRGTDYSVDELEHALELTKDEETTPDEEKILKGIVRFGSTDVKQIMTPRTEVIAFEQKTGFTELLSKLLDQGFSRVPVYDDSLDQVKGILYLKDLLPHAEAKNLQWLPLVRSPYFVPENKKLDDLLRDFQEKKVHMAIVVDEYGGTSGIVTLEDILEEIVGDITDEFDDENIFYSKLDESNYVFEGKTPLVDLYKILEMDGERWEEAKGESDTLAGFILERAGKIPLKNEKVKFENFVLTIEAADKRRIKRVKLTVEESEQEKSSKS
ncbi:MAG: gliding motility-associated protein GldE [Flavobacteriales bacterium]|nr:gliding motility-associated protein GldE [Flavobacteriales bacterium]